MAKRTALRTQPSVVSQGLPSDDGRPSASAGNKPAHTIRYGKLKAAIWKNDGQTGVFYNVTFSRSYQDGQNTWHDANSFNAHDLPLLAKLANDCHSWITWHERKAKDATAKSKAS